MTKRFLIPSSLILFGLVVSGCSGGSSGGGGSTAPAATNEGTIDVKLTDAPLTDLTGVTKAEITVERVLLHLSNGNTAPVGTGASTAPVATTTGQGQQGQQGQGQTNPNAGGAASQGQGQATTGGSNPNAGGAASQGQGQAQAGTNPNASGSGSQGQGSNAGGTNPNAGGGNGSGVGSGANWVTVFDAAVAGAPKVYNLLDLRGGIMADLAQANVPAGKYTQIRLELSDACLTMHGVDYSITNGLLKAPSNSIVISLNSANAIDVLPGQTSRALLDFDLSRSFNVIGSPQNPSSVQMNPVLRGANLDTTGTVAGVTRSDNGTPNDPSDDVALPNCMVTLTPKAQQGSGNGQGNAGAFTTFADAQGAYFVAGLEAGDWDVTFSEGGHTDRTDPATVTQGQQTTLDATLVKN